MIHLFANNFVEQANISTTLSGLDEELVRRDWEKIRQMLSEKCTINKPRRVSTKSIVMKIWPLILLSYWCELSFKCVCANVNRNPCEIRRSWFLNNTLIIEMWSGETQTASLVTGFAITAVLIWPTTRKSKSWC